MPSVDIVIVNWNTGGCLAQCLRSIEATSQASFRIDRVVVVDNASSDGSVDEHDSQALPLVVIRNAANRGFAAACNQGARGSCADYLLFLNPDTKLFAESLAKPVAYMESSEHQSAGICGIRLVNESGAPTTACARFPTLRSMFGKAAGLDRLWPNWYPQDLEKIGGGSITQEVDQVIGAFFLVRRSLYEALRGFDERFFVYFEEVDFSYRARAAGYTSVLVTEVEALHYGGVSSDQVKAARLFYSLRSRAHYVRKHFSRASAFGIILVTFAVELPSRVLHALMRRDLVSVREVLRAYAMLVSSWARGSAGPDAQAR